MPTSFKPLDLTAGDVEYMFPRYIGQLKIISQHGPSAVYGGIIDGYRRNIYIDKYTFDNGHVWEAFYKQSGADGDFIDDAGGSVRATDLQDLIQKLSDIF